jgi:serine phosphatase RsbU (regulator of sigma subunit)
MRRRREWALSYDEPRASVLIAAVLYLVGAALTATAALDPHVRSPAGVVAIAAVACVTALALLLAARRPLDGFAIAFAADVWGVVLIALLCAATAGATSPFALIYFFAICHAAAFQPSRRFALVSALALAAFLAPLVYDGVPTGFAPFAIVGVMLALLISCVIHFALAGLRAQRRRLQLMIAASAKLDISLDPSQTLRQMAHSAVPELAELCVIDLVDRDGAMECVAAASDPRLASRVEAMRREAPLDLAGTHPVAQALASGRPRVVGDLTAADALREAAQSDAHLRLMRDAGYRSAAVFPLRARNRTHGAISFLRVGEQSGYSDNELGVLEELATRAALAYDNARLYAERAHVASALQRSLMPPRLPEVPWLELASYFRPIGAANQIGGDFYDAFMGEQESCWLVIGDVCGKGPQAAAYTGLLRQSTRAYARGATSPAAVLANVNQAMLEQDFEEGFATAVLVLLRREDECIDATVAAAGHPPAVVIRADGGMEELGSGQLLGRFEEARVNDERTLLRAGDALALYTDGLSEAHAPQRILSVQELTAPLRASAPRTAQEIVDALLAPVGSDEGRDDIAILTALAREADPERPRRRSMDGRSSSRPSPRIAPPRSSVARAETAPSPLRAEQGGE